MYIILKTHCIIHITKRESSAINHLLLLFDSIPMTQRKKMLWASFAQQWKDLLIQAHAYIYITAAYCFRKLEPYLDPSVSGHVTASTELSCFYTGREMERDRQMSGECVSKREMWRPV